MCVGVDHVHFEDSAPFSAFFGSILDRSPSLTSLGIIRIHPNVLLIALLDMTNQRLPS